MLVGGCSSEGKKMLPDAVKKALRFYFITDDGAPDLSPLEQVVCAVQAGATLIQYRNKKFFPSQFSEVKAIRDFCKCNGVPFVVNDNILLAKAVDADGVHVGQDDENPAVARGVMGDHALIGISVSTLDELRQTDFSGCDYIGSGPVFSTATKADAKAVTGLSGLGAIIRQTDLPVVAIGGIDSSNAKSCFDHGADGVSVISAVSRAKDPDTSAQILGKVCGCSPRKIVRPWRDEFGLIEKLLKTAPKPIPGKEIYTRIAPGDDAGLLCTLKNPVITTDTQKEGVHFILDWQSPEEIGRKSVAITLSDLAACYAAPVSLFINLALPSHISDPFVESLYRGIQDALSIYNCALGGGNISRSAEFSIDLFAVGEGRDDLFPTRSAAKPGDGLYCTGPLGLSRAGLSCLKKKDAGFPALISKFISPSARFDAAKVLAENGVACVMDVSDGLAGDADHIARASGITIEFALKLEDDDGQMVSFCKKYALNPETMILAGGEDYELLFSCRPEVYAEISKALPEAVQVGTCHPFEGAHLRNLPAGVSSFQHGNL